MDIPTPTPLDLEIESLLETLAGGFLQDDACMCCGARLATMNAEVIANIHVANCPVLLARKRLALLGTPVKFWRIDYEVRRMDSEHVDAMGQLVIRRALSEQAALDRISDHLAHYQGKRRLVEGSIRI